MHEEEFLEAVRQEAPTESTNQAQNVAEATIRTLGERITDGEAEDIAQHLPKTLAATLTDVSSGEADPFSLDEFIKRVSDRAGIDDSQVVVHSRAVATALAEAADTELETGREQLPPEFDVIFEPNGPITEDAFLETVRTRVESDSTGVARDATTATLRTLSERLSEGEADDLSLYLPDPLAEEIVETGNEQIAAYSFDEFIRRVSQREGIEKETARTHAQAVCSTLADAASTRELDATKEQLPDSFGPIFEPPNATTNDN